MENNTMRLIALLSLALSSTAMANFPWIYPGQQPNVPHTLIGNYDIDGINVMALALDVNGDGRFDYIGADGANLNMDAYHELGGIHYAQGLVSVKGYKAIENLVAEMNFPRAHQNFGSWVEPFTGPASFVWHAETTDVQKVVNADLTIPGLGSWNYDPVYMPSSDGVCHGDLCPIEIACRVETDYDDPWHHLIDWIEVPNPEPWLDVIVPRNYPLGTLPIDIGPFPVEGSPEYDRYTWPLDRPMVLPNGTIIEFKDVLTPAPDFVDRPAFFLPEVGPPGILHQNPKQFGPITVNGYPMDRWSKLVDGPIYECTSFQESASAALIGARCYDEIARQAESNYECAPIEPGDNFVYPPDEPDFDISPYFPTRMRWLDILQ
jgi:hypothetical protein